MARMEQRHETLPDDPRELAWAEARARLGGLKPLAAKLGISRQAISVWKIVPSKHAVKVSEETGVSLHELRPDIYPDLYGPKAEERASRPEKAEPVEESTKAVSETTGLLRRLITFPRR
jgi:DNA-binding transcriptional regulator YdaS (Cro superfamily)